VKIEKRKNVKSLFDLTLAGSLFLYSGLSDLGQLIGILFLYLVITFYQITKQNSSVQYFNLITISGVTLLTFEFQWSNTTRISILFAFTILLFLIHRKNLILEEINYSYINLIFVILFASVRVLENSRNWLIQFLGFGYDNAFHLTMFRGYRLTSWFPDATQPNWWTDFDLFRVAPAGSSALFSIFSNALIGNNHDSHLEMTSFALINLSMTVAILAISFQLISIHLPIRYDKRILFVILPGVSALIIYLAGTMLVNGFPPYVAATLVLVYWVRLQPMLKSTSARILNLSFAAFVLLLITPGPFAFLILPGIYLMFKLLLDYIATRDLKNFLIGLVIPFLLGSFSFFEFNSTSGSFGWRQILAPGGVHKPNLLLAMTIAALFILISIKYRSEFSLWLVTLSGALSVGIFSIVTFVNTGDIQYYAWKQLYVWLPLAILFVVTQMFEIKFFTKVRLSVQLTATFICFILFLAVWNNSTSSGFMGTPISAIKNLTNQVAWDQSIVYGNNFLDDYSSSKLVGSGCIISRINPSESDLNSRWANALSNPLRMSSKCFDGYWNSSQLTTLQLLDRLGNLDENFLLVIPLNERFQYSDLVIPRNIKIEFR
jgi:hypothetical protein